MGQYLDEALFLMQLIGIRVFTEEEKKTKRRQNKKNPQALNHASVSVSLSPPPKVSMPNKIPPLPNIGLKIGEFVYTAMRNLEKSGFVFSPEQINNMCSVEWAKRVFHTTKPFMKLYVPGVTDNNGFDGFVRFKSDPYIFGDTQVLISKEWYERQRKYFIDWYNSLK